MHLVMTWSGGMRGGREAPKGEDISLFIYISTDISITVDMQMTPP